MESTYNLKDCTATFGTRCLICGETVPLYGYDSSPKICMDCRNAVLEMRTLISELRKLKEKKDGN